MTIRVVAVERGFDNLVVREIGDEFDMPDDVFDRRPKLGVDGEPIKDQFYEPPHWFEPVDKGQREKVLAERKAVQKMGRTPVVTAVNPVRQQADRDAELSRQAAASKTPAVEPAKKP